MTSEISTDKESTDDSIIKYINQKRDEIKLAIKKRLANVEPTTTQTGDTLGKLCLLLFYVIITLGAHNYY